MHEMHCKFMGFIAWKVSIEMVLERSIRNIKILGNMKDRLGPGLMVVQHPQSRYGEYQLFRGSQ